MACTVCNSLDQSNLERVRSLYEQGRGIEDLAREFHVDYNDMQTHCLTCMSSKPSNAERLVSLITSLTSDIEVARQHYLGNPEDRDAAGSYTAMVKELRMAVEAAQGMARPEDQANEFVQDVLNPLIQSVTMGAIEELGRVREELLAAGVATQAVTTILNARATALSVRIKQAMTEAVRTTHKIHGLPEGTIRAAKSAIAERQN